MSQRKDIKKLLQRRFSFDEKQADTILDLYEKHIGEVSSETKEFFSQMNKENLREWLFGVSLQERGRYVTMVKTELNEI